jgi:hypothetical protein
MMLALVGVLSLLLAAIPPANVANAQTTQTVEAAPALDATTVWAKTNKDTGIWSGWDDKAQEFARVGKDIAVNVLELRDKRVYVYFPGDSRGHKPGEVWIDRADLTAMPWPRWARARRTTTLRTAPDAGSDEIVALGRGQYVETTGETRGRWTQAFFLVGQGSGILDRGPGEWVVGWIDALDLMLPRGDQAEISTYMLTRTALISTTPEVWLRVPYRSQIDGSPYADANCGPTSVAMALEAVGKSEPLGTLRELALDLQQNSRCDDCGTYIQHLAAVAEMRGGKSYGLRDDAGAFRRWTTDDVRAELRQGRVVIPQVKYRQLPGRSKAGYGGDHYIVVVGIAGTSFIYNDPVDSDGRGYGRLITAEQLDAAMSSANGEFARVAFAVGK